MTNLIVRGSVNEIIKSRNEALEHAEATLRAAMAAEKAFKAALGDNPGYLFNRHGSSVEISGLPYDEEGIGTSLQSIRKHIDRNAWRHLISLSGMRDMMNSRQIDQMNQELEKEVPELTLEAVEEIFRNLYENKDKTFREGVVGVFERMNPMAFKSHDGFKIGRRIVFTSILSSWGGWSIYGNKADYLSDIDRIFHIVDEKEPKGKGSDLAALISSASHKGEKEVKTEYFTAKLYKNGNVHLWMDRPDVVSKVNAILADHFGSTIPDGRRAA